jgi:hypothetical protein
LASPDEKPATQFPPPERRGSEDKLLNILFSIFTLLTGIIEGKDSFKVLDKPQLRDALCSKISFNPSKVVCLFSNINDTICLNITKSPYLLVIN